MLDNSDHKSRVVTSNTYCFSTTKVITRTTLKATFVRTLRVMLDISFTEFLQTFGAIRAVYTGYTQKNGAVSKVNKKFISHITRAQRTPSAAATVQVSHALPAVRFSCLLRGRGTSLQDGIAAVKGFLCAPF